MVIQVSKSIKIAGQNSKKMEKKLMEWVNMFCRVLSICMATLEVSQGADWEYVFNLWLAHGITTIREPSGRGINFTLDLKKKAANNEIIAPRIISFTRFGEGVDEIETPEEAREWVRNNAKKGADGIKFFGAAPKIMKAALDENKRLGLRSACHHSQMSVARWNVLHSARAGLTTMEHWYGLPEALFEDRTVQNYPLNYNYQNEQHRFEEAGKLWEQAAPPYSDHWNQVMDELLALDFTLDPTFNIYEASRDLHRARRAEWHETYTLPLFGGFTNLVKCLMAPIGTFGERNKKLPGRKISIFG